ncbi:hypothetical protein TOPH_02230 [Tolypocladium ophioglossoides CBS 100239]|uniref:CCHC-type domain-containing protein n=1 Tax=Tolypocladium ophioglossoides (strain CBS 100239) TaxID=1163406 RepID=A0A0L0NHF3_TOLOC|nr:hypothetical protein TOPH_02230 [Tolypocladium ophioglossoides CBS 100239]
MESKDQILWNLREVVGLNGFRSLADLAPMRQENLERRLTAAQYRLSPAGIASIYATWLQEQVFREGAMPPLHVVQRWCHYLAYRGCKKNDLQVIWMRAALTTLEKWCDVMSPDKVRDVRQAIYDEIAGSYPGDIPNTAMDVDAMPPTPTSTLQGTLNEFGDVTINPYTYLSAAGVARSNGYSTPTESSGRYPGFGMVRATGDTTEAPDHELTFEKLPPKVHRVEEVKHVFCGRCNLKGHHSGNCPAKSTQEECRTCGAKGHPSKTCPGKNFGYGPRSFPSSHTPMAEQVSHQPSVPPRRGRKTDSYRPSARDANQQQHAPLGGLQGLSLGSSTQGKPGSNSSSATEERPADLDDDQFKLKPLNQMSEVEREALRKADDFLARLSNEVAMETSTRLPAPASVLETATIGHAAKKQMTKTGRGRIPVLGALVEPARLKPKAPPAAASSAEVEMEDSGPPTGTAEAEPLVELGVTTKPVVNDSGYAVATQALFQNRDNVWVNRAPRKTALEMWDEMDAKAAEEKKAAEKKAAE